MYGPHVGLGLVVFLVKHHVLFHYVARMQSPGDRHMGLPSHEQNGNGSRRLAT
jgi:hypothetical protein